MLYTEELAQKLLEAIEGVEIKAGEGDEWTFDVVATTQDTDRDGESIMVSGWDTKNWDKNPVILANHSYTIQNIIGKGIKFYNKDGVKRLKGSFSQSNPLWVLSRNLYREGMLNAVSVWFMVKERDPNDYKIITKAELLEVSFVAIPCNPNALSTEQRALMEEGVQKWLLVVKEAEEEIIEEVIEAVEPVSELQEIKNLLLEIKAEQIEMKALVKTVTDGNVSSVIDEDIEEQQKITQNIDKYVGEALREFKRLKQFKKTK